MRFLGLASLVLATVLGANNASAGYITIDDFDSAAVAGRSSFGVTIGAGSLSGNGLVGFVSYDFLTYSGGALDFTVNDTIALRNLVTNDPMGPPVANLQVSAEIVANGNTYNAIPASKNISGASGPGSLKFNFAHAGADLANVTSLTVAFQVTGGGSFSTSQLQAIPEPTTLALIGLVGAGGGFAGYRKRRKVVA